MSDAFDELEAELDQSIVDRKHDEIERKNLLIEHDNIIADGLSKEVFYVASNSELNVSRFTEMQKAHNVVKARCLELEAELSNLRNNIRKDNYNELLNRFSNLEVNHLNLQLKYQNLKDSFQNKPSSSVNDTPDFNSVFVIGQMKASLQGKDNVKPNVLAPGKYAIDVEPIPPRNRNNREVHLVYLRHLKESVDTLREIVDRNAKVEKTIMIDSIASACRYTKAFSRTIKYVFGTLVQRSYKSSLGIWTHGCTENICKGYRSRAHEFLKKFYLTVRFGNDHFGAIMGYGDYVVGDSVISSAKDSTAEQKEVVVPKDEPNSSRCKLTEQCKSFFKGTAVLMG
ncbi:hypothetical protein Tco_0620241 [Tanacetum coccineum]